MSFGQFLSILKARWLVLLAALLLTVVTTAIVSFSLPKQYTATASVIVDAKSPDPISGMVMPGAMLPGYITTQIDVMTSERVARKAIRSLGLERNEQLREQWQEATGGAGDMESWLSEILSKNLDIKPAKDSSVINVSYSALEGNFAAAMVNAFVQGYIDTTLELRIEPARQFSRLFDEQTKQARDRLETAQSKLSAYQKEKGIIATDERLDVETARLNDLSAQVVALQSQTADAVSRRSHSGANTPEVLNNIVVAGLRSDLARQEVKLKEYQAKFGSSHPQVQEVQATLNELRSRIALETRDVNTSVGVSSNVSQQRESQVRAALEAQRKKVLQIKEQRDEASVLVRDVENAQRTYDGIQARFAQTSLESQSNQTNVSVLRVASRPSTPSSPKILLNIVLSVLVGAVLGVAASLGMELIDRRLRSDRDIVDALGAPMLGVMPTVKDEHKGGLGFVRSPLRLSQNRALPELTSPNKA